MPIRAAPIFCACAFFTLKYIQTERIRDILGEMRGEMPEKRGELFRKKYPPMAKKPARFTPDRLSYEP